MSAKCTPTETISSTSTRRVGELLVGEAVDERAERRDDRQRQQRSARAAAACSGAAHSVTAATTTGASERAQRAAHERRGGRPRRSASTTSSSAASDGEREQQPDRARHLAELQQRERQRAEGDELALRDEDDARDREHQHDRQRQQRVDGAVGDAVEQQDAGDREVHASRQLQARPRDRRTTARSASARTTLPVAVDDLQHHAGLVACSRSGRSLVQFSTPCETWRAAHGLECRPCSAARNSGGAGLALLQRDRHDLLEHDGDVEGVAGELVARAGAVGLLVLAARSRIAELLATGGCRAAARRPPPGPETTNEPSTSLPPMRIRSSVAAPCVW